MNDEILRFKRMQGWVLIAMSFGLVAVLCSWGKNMVIERWANKKSLIACVPDQVASHHPMVYHQSTANPVNQDAQIKSFVEDYVRLTQDEQVVNYHAVSSNERYKNARLSEARWKAIEMSTASERALNMKRYHESNDVFYMLQEGNVSWVFLIDDILVQGIPGTNGAIAIVRGEIQVTYDQIKTELPNRLWGYKEIRLMIQQGLPSEDDKGALLNKYGLYVSWSDEKTLSPTQKEQAARRNSEYYLLNQK